jgi:phosphatidylserine/phosphatidylglycerophosphate/cardiolipin synthase-like enzyme
MSASPETRGRFLIAAAIVASLALVFVYLAAGGSSYEPAKTQDPCKPRPWTEPEGLQEIAQQFSLSALDGAACQLGVSRETLARALATPESRERFTQRYGIGDAELARAIRAGLLRAIDDAERAGALSPLLGAPLRATVRQIPIDQAIELIKDARSLLDNLESFLGPAGGLIEQFLP